MTQPVALQALSLVSRGGPAASPQPQNAVI